MTAASTGSLGTPRCARNWESRIWQIGANAVQPLFEGGRNVVNLGAARARYEQAVGTYRGRVLTAFQEVENALNDLRTLANQAEAQERADQAWEQVQTTAENIALRQQQILSAQGALDGMTEEERVGDRTSTDRLYAVQELLDSRVAEIQAEHDHTVAMIQMTAATGEFTAEKLDLKVNLYDPDRHYNESRRRWFGTGDASAQ